MRRVVIGGLLIGLLALAWYVDSLLARTLWVNNFVAETRSGDWYTGWPILWHAWPLALVGILVGGSFALLGVGLVYGWANEGDQEREMERLRQVAIEAEQRAEQAEATALTKAQTALQQEREAVQALQADAAQSIQLAESRRQAATRAIAEVDQRVALITQERDEAKRKAANATATIRRHQAKAVAK